MWIHELSIYVYIVTFKIIYHAFRSKMLFGLSIYYSANNKVSSSYIFVGADHSPYHAVRLWGLLYQYLRQKKKYNAPNSNAYLQIVSDLHHLTIEIFKMKNTVLCLLFVCSLNQNVVYFSWSWLVRLLRNKSCLAVVNLIMSNFRKKVTLTLSIIPVYRSLCFELVGCMR